MLYFPSRPVPSPFVVGRREQLHPEFGSQYVGDVGIRVTMSVAIRDIWFTIYVDSYRSKQLNLHGLPYLKKYNHTNYKCMDYSQYTWYTRTTKDPSSSTSRACQTWKKKLTRQREFEELFNTALTGKSIITYINFIEPSHSNSDLKVKENISLNF